MSTVLSDRTAVQEQAAIASPAAVRLRLERLLRSRDERNRKSQRLAKQFGELNSYLEVAGKVTVALEQLNEQLFDRLLTIVQEKLTLALQEILQQPICFKAQMDFKRGGASVDFWVERDGNREDVLKGQGGSVANILSVGLRMFALTTLDPQQHRPFLVLDEQDCWLRPDLVPGLVKIVHEAGQALGIQTLMISHHDVSVFERYADRIYQLSSGPDGAVKVRRLFESPAVADPSEERFVLQPGHSPKTAGTR